MANFINQLRKNCKEIWLDIPSIWLQYIPSLLTEPIYSEQKLQRIWNYKAVNVSYTMPRSTNLNILFQGICIKKMNTIKLCIICRMHKQLLIHIELSLLHQKDLFVYSQKTLTFLRESFSMLKRYTIHKAADYLSHD
jgi:hypothetical protein